MSTDTGKPTQCSIRTGLYLTPPRCSGFRAMEGNRPNAANRDHGWFLAIPLDAIIMGRPGDTPDKRSSWGWNSIFGIKFVPTCHPPDSRYDHAIPVRFVPM